MASREGKYEEEGWRLRKDGTRFWASVVITALRDQEGTLRGFAKVTRDITARRESERIKSIVDNVVNGIVTFDENGVIESFNGKWLSLLNADGRALLELVEVSAERPLTVTEWADAAVETVWREAVHDTIPRLPRPLPAGGFRTIRDVAKWVFTGPTADADATESAGEIGPAAPAVGAVGDDQGPVTDILPPHPETVPDIVRGAVIEWVPPR